VLDFALPQFGESADTIPPNFRNSPDPFTALAVDA
jgi:hypothetical protein